MKKLILPAAIVLMGVGAAFVTKASKSSPDTEPGAYFENGVCNMTEEECSVEGLEICTYVDASSTSHDLQRFVNNTQCGITLRKP